LFVAESGAEGSSVRSTSKEAEGMTTMDATRRRRTRDRARQRWYARQRQRRFARFLGFPSEDTEATPADRAAKP